MFLPNEWTVQEKLCKFIYESVRTMELFTGNPASITTKISTILGVCLPHVFSWRRETFLPLFRIFRHGASQYRVVTSTSVRVSNFSENRSESLTVCFPYESDKSFVILVPISFAISA